MGDRKRKDVHLSFLYGTLFDDYIWHMNDKLHEVAELHDQMRVFLDRRHAGKVLAGILHERRSGRAIVLAIPSGGVPVAVEIAGSLKMTLDVAVVNKILLPWTDRVGFWRCRL